MLAADSVITDPATWDASAWIAAFAALVALCALGVASLARRDSHESATATSKAAGSAERSAKAAERSAMTGEAAVKASQRSADAAEEATALARQEADWRARDREDAAGPVFIPEEATVGVNRSAPITLRIVGGPGRMRVVVRPVDVPWCTGVVGHHMTEAGESVEYPPLEPGDSVRLYAYVSTLPYSADEPVVLPLEVTAEADGGGQQWTRRVSVPLVAAPPSPMAVPRDPTSPNPLNMGF